MKAKKIIGLILAVCLLFGITLMIAVGAAETPEAVPATEVDTVDALQAALIEETGYRNEQFAVIHPGGAVGERLNRREERR